MILSVCVCVCGFKNWWGGIELVSTHTRMLMWRQFFEQGCVVCLGFFCLLNLPQTHCISLPLSLFLNVFLPARLHQTGSDSWTAAERRQFNKGITAYKKDFFMVQKQVCASCRYKGRGTRGRGGGKTKHASLFGIKRTSTLTRNL